MILAAGVTPAWQQILLFDSFSAGEVNRAQQAYWCASGKVLNVGIALHHLGGACKTIATVGGRSGEQIKNEFAELGISACWIDSISETRVCTTILDRQTGETTELVEESKQLTTTELELFTEEYAREAAHADVVVLSGSLPTATPKNFYAELMQRTPGKVILDVRGDELIEALKQKPFLVKPNREELGRTVGQPLNKETQLIAAMQKLNERGAKWVVISQGKDAVYATSAGDVYRFQPPCIEVINPIGCGDCLAAGIAWAVERDSNTIDAIRLGMAAAADNLKQLLPSRLNRNWIEQTAKSMEVVRL